MSTNTNSLSGSRGQRGELIHRLIHGYLDQAGTEHAAAREAFLRRHADLLPELRWELDRQQLLRAERRKTAIRVTRPESTTLRSEEVSSGISPWFVSFPPTRRFQYVRTLGRGGQSIVFEAVDRERGNHRVALKTSLSAAPESLGGFKREFSSLVELRHPNLVTLYDVFSEKGCWFYTMELVEGANIRDYVRSLRSLQGLRANPDRLRNAFWQLAEALQFIHGQGRLHRDIKPSNVMVRTDGRLVLLDLGLVAKIHPPRFSGTYVDSVVPAGVVGTLDYIAPELFLNAPATEASDLYSFGVALFECITGGMPIPRGEETYLEYQRRKVTWDPPSLESIRGQVPAPLARLCVGLLQREPGARPGVSEILDTLARLGGRSVPQSNSAKPSRFAYVGRETQLAGLEQAFVQASARREAVCLHLHGASGTGKSTLVSRFLYQLWENHPEAVILAGRCFEQATVPFEAVDSLVDALARHLKRLDRVELAALIPRHVDALALMFPVLNSIPAVREAPQRAGQIPDKQELRRRAFSALREILCKIGDRAPLVLFIDDLQWGDVDSARLLVDLFQPPDLPVLTLILSYRTEDREGSPCLQHLEAARREPWFSHCCREIPLPPLSFEDAQELALEHLGRERPNAEPHAARIAHESEGNAFFIGELARFLERRWPATSTADQDITIEGVLLSRVREMSREHQRLLEVIAVAGKPLRQRDAFSAAGLEHDLGLARDVLDELIVRNLAKSHGRGPQDTVETYHDRVRKTVVSSLPPDHIKSSYARLANALETSGKPDSETFAAYCLGAGQSRRAGRLYAAAADHAVESLAFDRAVKLYRQAIKYAGFQPEERRVHQIKLGDALTNAGRSAEAADVYSVVARDAPDPERLDLESRAAIQRLYSGNLDDGLRQIRAALESVGLPYPRSRWWTLLRLLARRMQLRLSCLRADKLLQTHVSKTSPRVTAQLDLSWSAAVGLTVVDSLIGAYYQTENACLALRHRDPARAARAVLMHIWHLEAAGTAHPDRIRRLFTFARELSNGQDDAYLCGLTELSHGTSAYMKGDWCAARRRCQQAEKIFRERCRGAVWELNSAGVFLVYATLNMGRLRELQQESRERIQAAETRNDLYSVTMLRSGSLPYSLLADDQPQESMVMSASAVSQWSSQEYQIPHFFQLLSRAQGQLYLGDTADAFDTVQSDWGRLIKSSLRMHQVTLAFARYLRAQTALWAAASRTHDREKLIRIASREARQVGKVNQEWAHGMADMIHARISVMRNDLEDAKSRYRRAASIFQSTHMELRRLVAQRCLGAITGGEQGGQLKATADQMLKDLGVKRPERFARVIATGDA